MKLLDFFVSPRNDFKKPRAFQLWEVFTTNTSTTAIPLVSLYNTIEFFVTFSLEAAYYHGLGHVDHDD